MKVEPGAVHETYSAPAFIENELIEVRDMGCPVSITFPVVKTEIQVSCTLVSVTSLTRTEHLDIQLLDV
jgi:hypothetical protein